MYLNLFWICSWHFRELVIFPYWIMGFSYMFSDYSGALSYYSHTLNTSSLYFIIVILSYLLIFPEGTCAPAQATQNNRVMASGLRKSPHCPKHHALCGVKKSFSLLVMNLRQRLVDYGQESLSSLFCLCTCPNHSANFCLSIQILEKCGVICNIEETIFLNI